MFSGIVERVAEVAQAEPIGGAMKLVLRTGFEGLDLGESIAVNGVCLTVSEMDSDGSASFFMSRETLDRSNLAGLRVGGAVNLERSVRLETRLSGHLVQGHVDGKAVVTAIHPDGETRLLALSLPAELHPFCVEKGSIALDGISLTLNAVGGVGADGRFAIEITIIPHTWEHTNLSRRSVGSELNVEVDVIAKYVERLCQPYLRR